MLAVTLAVAAVSVALLVEALAPRQLLMAAFGRRRLSGARTLAADQVSHLDSIMVVLEWLPCGQMDSLAQSVGPQARMSADPLRLIGNQTV